MTDSAQPLPDSPRDTGTSRWLSREFSELLGELDQQGEANPGIDVLIVGSGYGGAIAAAELAGTRDERGRTIRVCVLERGREYLPGSFPSKVADLPTEVRGHVGARSRGGEALFDLRIGSAMNVVLANGLGGGSLINAGVMEVPGVSVFDARWPAALRGRSSLDASYGECEQLLGAKVLNSKGQWERNTIRRHPEHAPPRHRPAKQEILRTLAPGRFRDAAVTVAMREGATTAGNVKLSLCKRCGDCASGCNHGAKESLDTNLLARAVRRGARVYCGATVLRIEPLKGEGWRVQVTPTDEHLRLREGAPKWIRTRRLILAAGSLGSTEILLRSQQQAERSAADPQAATTLRFSERLGQAFSGNGDLLAFGYAHREKANAIANEDTDAGVRGIGPTITGILDERAGAGGEGQAIAIEEMAVPGILRRFTEEMLATADTLRSLGEMDCSRHGPGHPPQDPCAIHPDRFANTSVFAVMGDDGAGGRLELDQQTTGIDGCVRVRWEDAPKLPLAKAQLARLEKLVADSSLGGRILPNPLWQPLPGNMSALIGDAAGALLTVHPLGGCAMGDDARHGVVDDCGRVYCRATRDSTGHATYAGLVVLDGSILPTALSTNPALTIAAVALRAVRELRAKWKLKAFDRPESTVVSYRPVIAPPPRERLRKPTGPQTTRAQFTERLGGEVWLSNAVGGPDPVRCWVDLTLPYEEVDLAELTRPDDQGRLSGARLVLREAPARDGQDTKTGKRRHRRGNTARLRIFLFEDWKKVRHLNPSDRNDREQIDRYADIYALSGSLSFGMREPSTEVERILAGLGAWWLNRGARDLWQAGEALWAKLRRGEWPRFNGGAAVLGALNLASRAGERRYFSYELKIGERLTPSSNERRYVPKNAFEGRALLGSKRITYARASNPWRQLMEMSVDQMPNLEPSRATPVLKLDLRFLAARATPLFRLTEQRDHVNALIDVISLMMVFLRLLVPIHIWQARRPDRPADRKIDRMPPRQLRKLEAQVTELPVEVLHGAQITIRLTRYAPAAINKKLPPLIAVHGYSASGTTFAHAAMDPSFTEYMVEQGRDVWVLDLRTSPGQSHAQHPWTFERVALGDIPLALEHVCETTRQPRVDVVAHCMGAAMLSMAVLSAGEDDIERIWSPRDSGTPDPGRDRRRKVPERIRSVVLSQAGPLPILSPMNTLRAFAASYIDHLFGPFRYSFRPEDETSAGNDLLDRLLSTLPYPKAELLQEQPAWPCKRVEYARTRHRMDALYGQVFKLDNIGQPVLDHLDDFFGPISLDTVAQVRHFAQNLAITNRGGRNRFVNHDRLRDLWPHHTLVLHGEHNGLLDPGTAMRVRKLFEEAGRDITYLAPRSTSPEGSTIDSDVEERQGHQDVFIGRNSVETFAAIEKFLRGVDARSSASPHQRVAERIPYRFVAHGPRLGPTMVPAPTDANATRRIVSMGADPQLGAPDFLCFVPLLCVDGRWVVDDQRYRRGAGGVARGRGHPRDLVRDLIGHPDTDWFSVDLPAWAGTDEHPVVMPVLLYPQAESMHGTAFGAGEPKEPDWNSLDYSVLRQLILRKRTLSNEQNQAMRSVRHDAIAEAMNRMQERLDSEQDDLPQSRTPEGGTECPPPPRGALFIKPLPQAGLRLVLGSCQYAAGILDALPAAESWKRLNDRLDVDSVKPDLILLTGDQIYADATAGLFDPTRADDRYRNPYEIWLGQHQVQRALARVPLLALIDDHEIDNNWEPIAPDAPEKARARHEYFRDEGIKAYQRFQRAQPSPSLWSDLRWGQVPMFIADARTERSLRNTATLENAAMFKPEQTRRLCEWLLEQHRERADVPKLIATPVALVPRRRYAPDHALLEGRDTGGFGALRSDTWDGFPRTLREVLGLIAEHGIRRVVFLSGDEHMGLFATARLNVNGQCRATIHSVHAPGLYTPYPFANAHAEDFLLEDRFELEGAADGRSLEVEVDATLIDASGFVSVNLLPQAEGEWTLHCTYEANEGTVEPFSVQLL